MLHHFKISFHIEFVRERKMIRTEAIEEESDRREGKGRRRCWLGDRIDSIPWYTSQDDLKKGWTEKWILGGMLRKKDDHSVHTTAPTSKRDVLSKTFLPIILTPKWLVLHSNTSPKHLEWPLPSLLSGSYSMDVLKTKNCTRTCPLTNLI